MITVFGASGLIGRHMLELCASDHVPAAGTCFRKNIPGLVRCDLAGAPEEAASIAGKGPGLAIIAVGAGGVDHYRAHPAEAAALNAGIMRLLSLLRDRGIVPALLSSDYVFEGISGGYREDSPAAPTTEYGRRKRELEEWVLDNLRDYRIIRLGKVYGYTPGDGTLLTDIFDRLSRGEVFRAAADQLVAPTSVRDAARGILAIALGAESGVFHVSSPEVRSRYDLAAAVCRALGRGPELVERVRLEDLSFGERRPADTTMNADATSARFGLSYRPLGTELAAISALYGR